ncbi:hypothetical protein GCM10009737_23860 [Nocardioides lentus]|uniref:Ricin B lectin domain-containing protein n=1 Tax=Nocardioides lentus TaxID=338077 RepID=A0ABP5AST4_9ACTN
MNSPTDRLPDLEGLSRHGASSARLTTPAEIRGAAARRTRRRAATGAAAVAVAVVAVAPSLLSLTGAGPTDRVAPTGPPAATGPSGAHGPSDGEAADRAVDIRTYAGRWVAPDVEGGVRTFRSRAASPLETGWRLVPGPGDRVRIVAVSTVDGRDLCLTDSGGVDHVTVSLCEERAQLFDVTEVGQPGVVTISSGRGLIGADPGRGPLLEPAVSPESPATVFTLE